MAGETQQQDQDYTKLSLDERIDHKQWKARQLAYEELAKTFGQNNPKSSKDFQRYGPYMKKALAESNVLVFEKGIDATFAFVKNGEEIAGRHASEIAAVAISKGFGATKPTIKAKISELLFLYIELEKQKEIVEELLNGFANKSPKIVTSCVSTLRDAIHMFGPKAVGVKPVMKKFAALLEERDKSVRDEAKLLCVELFRWLGGDVLKPQLEGLKPIQHTELEAEFEKVKDEGRPKPSRLLRSEQVAAAAAVEDVANEVDGGEAAAPVLDDSAEADIAELIEPVDILSRLPGDFYTKLESKNWKDRKEVLDELDNQLKSAVRIRADADYNELIRYLKKIIQKDVNVNVVAVSGTCLAKLATRLKSSFSSAHAKDCLAVCFEKFKEKNKLVVKSIKEATDALFRCVPGIDALVEEILPAITNKTPTVRSETLLFLARALLWTTPDRLPKPFLKQFIPPLVENTGNADQDVRDAAAEVLGTCQKVIGESALKPFLGDTISPPMQEKIKEACEKAVILAKPKRKPAAPAAAVKPGTVAKQPATKKKTGETEPDGGKTAAKTVVRGGGGKPAAAPGRSRRESQSDDDVGSPSSEHAAGAVKGTAVKQPRAASSTRAAVAGTAGKPGAATTSKVRAVAAGAKVSPKPNKDDPNAGPATFVIVPKANKKHRIEGERKLQTLKWNFETPSPEYVALLKEQLQVVASPTLVTLMFSDDFKNHLKAIDMLNDAVETCPEASLDASDLILKWFSLRFFDTNPAVLLKGLEFLGKYIPRLGTEHGYTLDDAEANAFFPYLMLKAGEPKDAIRAQVRQVVDNCAFAYPPVYPPTMMFTIIRDRGLKSKNARQRAECLGMLGSYIERYGLGICDSSATAAGTATSKAGGNAPSATVTSTLKLVAAQISDRDSGVRNAALNCLLEAHAYAQDDMFKMIGKLPEKEKSLLLERVKRSAKVAAIRPTLSLNNVPSSLQAAGGSADSVPRATSPAISGKNAPVAGGTAAVPKSQSMGNFRRNNRYSTIVLNKQGKSTGGLINGGCGDTDDDDDDSNEASPQNNYDAEGDAGDASNVPNPRQARAQLRGPASALRTPPHLQNGYADDSHLVNGNSSIADGTIIKMPGARPSGLTAAAQLTAVRRPSAPPMGRSSTEYRPSLNLVPHDPATLAYCLEDVALPELSDPEEFKRALINNDRSYFAASKKARAPSSSSSSSAATWSKLLQPGSVFASEKAARHVAAADAERRMSSPELEAALRSLAFQIENSLCDECCNSLKLIGEIVARDVPVALQYRQDIGRVLKKLIVEYYVVMLNNIPMPAPVSATDGVSNVDAQAQLHQQLPPAQGAVLHKIYARTMSIFLSLALPKERQPLPQDPSSDSSAGGDAAEADYSPQVLFFADCLHSISALMSTKRIVKQALPQGDALHVNANKLALKIVSDASAPVLIVSLLMVMLRAAPSSKQSHSVIHMAQKCLWRLIKRFTPPSTAAAASANTTTMNETVAVQPEPWHTSWTYPVLKVCSDFLTQCPPEFWTDFAVAEANPMRTIKYIITTIGKSEGGGIFQERHFSRFPFDNNIALHNFVHPLLAKMPAKGELVVDDGDTDNGELLRAQMPLRSSNEYVKKDDNVIHSVEYREFLTNLLGVAQQKADMSAAPTESIVDADELARRLRVGGRTSKFGSNNDDTELQLASVLRSAQQALLFSRQQRKGEHLNNSDLSPSPKKDGKAVTLQDSSAALEEDFLAVNLGMRSSVPAANDVHGDVQFNNAAQNKSRRTVLLGPHHQDGR